MSTPSMLPPPHVLRAFGVSCPVEPLSGGRGTAWRSAGVVLKPFDTGVDEKQFYSDQVSGSKATKTR